MLGTANCPCSGALLVDGADEEAVGWSVSCSESESEAIFSMNSLFELSESASEELLRVRAILMHPSGCAFTERSTQERFLEMSSSTDVLVDERSFCCCCDLSELRLALFFHEKVGMNFHLRCPIGGERACSCLARPQEGGANIVVMRVNTLALRYELFCN